MEISCYVFAANSAMGSKAKLKVSDTRTWRFDEIFETIAASGMFASRVPSCTNHVKLIENTWNVEMFHCT